MNSESDNPARAPGPKSQGGDRPPDERWSLVQRVIQDESFRRAPRLRALLLYVTEKAIDGRAVELNEHEIARAVFRRAETFNSADDSIVRSSARQLRTKLHEYFEGAGRDEPVIIEIPKGSYVPEFPQRSALPGHVAPPAQTGGRLWKTLFIGAAVTALLLAVLLIRGGSTQKRESRSAEPPSLVTWLFGSAGQQVNVVLCDSALVVVNSYRNHMVSLDDYIQQRDQQPLPLPKGNPTGATPPEFPGKRLITSFRDMPFVERLSALSAAAGFRVALKHSRLMQVRDFRTGNHILLGSAWSNPWTTLFEEQLNFRFAEHAGDRSFSLMNAQPQPGEQASYRCSPAQAHDGVSYARIAIVPNLSGEDAILLVSGLHTESSEGALDSALSPVFLDEIKRVTNARTPSELSGLELLLEVRAVDGVVHGTRLVASRHHRK
jgi:hypothetical protein